MGRLYFGHPIPMDSGLEDKLLDAIEDTFPDYEIENPSDQKHKDSYFAWRDEKDGVTGMDYYFQEVLPDCDAGVFLPFEDETYGAGTAEEMEVLANNGTPVYGIDRSGDIQEITVDEITALSIEETRDRLYDRRK